MTIQTGWAMVLDKYSACFGIGVKPQRLPGEGETDYRDRCKALAADHIEDDRAMVEQTPAVGGEPETVAWLLHNGDEGPVDSTVRWDVAKHWPEYAMPLIDRAHVAPLLARIAELEALCGELYQVLGALDAPAQVLDKVYAASNGDAIPSGDLLPFVPEPTAKIVLPDRADEHSPNPEDWGWNDAIDEVTRLNGGKP